MPWGWLQNHLPYRAYKLGKKRWSYNQVELVLGEADGDRRVAVQQAVHASATFPEACKAREYWMASC